MNILGLSFFYHDSSAALIIDGRVIGAVQEERFSRKKHDNRFPVFSIDYLLKNANLKINDIDFIVYYEDPGEKLNRILYSFSSSFPASFKTFLKAIQFQLKGKLRIKHIIRKETDYRGKIICVKHHQSHAASAFYLSPFSEAAFLTIDGVGEWNTLTFGVAKDNRLKIINQINFPHSLGLLYSAFTYYIGFRVNSGEYKLMGLAPYGQPKYTQLILGNLIDLKDDGSFKINMDYFDYLAGDKMINDKFRELFGRAERKPESKLTQFDMDVASSIQQVTEMAVMNLAKHVKKITNQKNLCLAGGVALNCVANGKIFDSKIFDKIWIQPASGDAGGSLGAALYFWHNILDKQNNKSSDYYFNPYLGPGYTRQEIKDFLDSNYISYSEHQNVEERTAQLIADGQVVGWFQGQMEYGPRALGNRSILGHPALPEMQSKMNLKIKFRESFRPFAPAVLEEYVKEWFEGGNRSPYMLLVFPLAQGKRLEIKEANQIGLDKLKVIRSQVPAITHVDYSARIQTVAQGDNQKFYSLIKHFYKLTKIPMVVNTSFNVRGEPIVCAPEEAYQCFMRTDIDYLVMENFFIAKKNQRIKKEISWQNFYELD